MSLFLPLFGSWWAAVSTLCTVVRWYFFVIIKFAWKLWRRQIMPLLDWLGFRAPLVMRWINPIAFQWFSISHRPSSWQPGMYRSASVVPLSSSRSNWVTVSWVWVSWSTVHFAVWSGLVLGWSSLPLLPFSPFSKRRTLLGLSTRIFPASLILSNLHVSVRSPPVCLSACLAIDSWRWIGPVPHGCLPRSAENRSPLLPWPADHPVISRTYSWSPHRRWRQHWLSLKTWDGGWPNRWRPDPSGWG